MTTIGEKIKKARRELRLTQADVAGYYITRNMLSAIESGKATPSLDTLVYLSKKLDLPLAYLISEDDDLFFFKKKERIQQIKNALDEKNYNVCINLTLKLERLDDELCLILADCYFNLGIQAVKGGAHNTAEVYLNNCIAYCQKTIYDTARFETIVPLYLSVARNVNAPLLDFEEQKFYDKFSVTTHYEFYKYLVQDFDYAYTYTPFALHIKAKRFIKERKYADAVRVLLEIDAKKQDYEYNSYLLYGVYTDLDICYRNLFDFENAYKYSSKRISLLEGFKA